jgi:hypothetical protein
MIVVIIQTFKNIHTIPQQCFHQSGGHFLLPMMLGTARRIVGEVHWDLVGGF